MSATLPESPRKSLPAVGTEVTLIAALFFVFAVERLSMGIPGLFEWSGLSLAMIGAVGRTAIGLWLLVAALALLRRAPWARRAAMVTAGALAAITVLHLGWVLVRYAPGDFRAAANPSPRLARHRATTGAVATTYVRNSANAAAVVVLDLVVLGALARRKPEEDETSEANTRD
jgi:hypothetical protein